MDGNKEKDGSFGGEGNLEKGNLASGAEKGRERGARGTKEAAGGSMNDRLETL